MAAASFARALARLAAAIALCHGAGAGAAHAQEIVLDRSVRAGELTLFPSAAQPTDYFYVPDRVRLAEGEGGLPKFSFTQYVDGGGVVGDAASGGGGLVHALIELEVEDELIADARRALTRLDPDAEIVGPAIFASGEFALISSFAEPDGDFTDALLGVGSAPLLEGQRAAVSVRLSQRGAEVLRGSLESPTPDVSFSFEMELDGYRSPRKATLEADFERVYAHDAFAAGIATLYLQAEIEAAFDDLRREGAIRLTQIGAEEELDELVRSAYAKLIEIMFERAPSTGASALTSLASAADGGPGVLERASELLGERRAETREANAALAQRNARRAERNGEAARLAAAAADARRRRDEAANRAENARELEARAQRRLEAENAARERLQNLSPQEREALERRLSAAERTLADRRAEADDAEQAAERAATEAETAGTTAEAAQAGVEELDEPAEAPSLAVVASYRMKRSKVSGSFRISLDKYTAASRTLRFDRNLGDLRPVLDRVVTVVDLSDSAFRRREVGVIVDGLDAEDFADFVNSVTVILEKDHEDGTTTARELSINRLEFDEAGGAFSLAYHRLGDSGLSDFMRYRYQVSWNFFGGLEIVEPERAARASDIVLSPPMARRSIAIEADPDIVADLGVRAIVIDIAYDPGDRERVERISLRPRGDGSGLSRVVDIVLPDDRADYSYETTWIMRDGSQRTTGPIASNQPILFADFMPED